MATAVFFHAHPDDESISTAGTMILASAAGHRVVLVTATDGALGEPTPGSIPEGSTLADVRAAELLQAADVMGVHRVEMLGYPDSGMAGEATSEISDCFWQAPVEDAARRLADAHAPATGMNANAQGLGRIENRLNANVAALWEQIKVVAGGCATGEQ